MAIYKKKVKEMKSDLYYKVKATDESTFDYQKNTRKRRYNRKSIKLAPGDWVEVSAVKNLDFRERKFLNWMHIFYIKKRSLFNLMFQIILMAIYVFAYAFTILEFKDNASFELVNASIIKDIILFFPLILLLVKAGNTLSKAVTIVGPNRTVKTKLTEFQSITFKDKRKKKRVIKFDSEANMLEDDKGTYYYGDTVKVSSSIYRFDMLIFNKTDRPLYKVEYYNVQVDFRQKEGILVTKGKKLEHSVVELNEYPIEKPKK